MNLTVQDITERLVPLTPDGDVDTLARQVRHWTASGVVRPVGTRHTGAGRARWYRESELYVAAVALELTLWRIPVGIAEAIAAEVRRNLEGDVVPTRKRMDFVRDAIKGVEGVVLAVRMPDRTNTLNLEVKVGMFQDVVGAIRMGGATSFVVVDLTALFRKVRG